MGRRIAAGLGSHQNTTGISDSLAILPSNGGVLHNSYEPLSLDPHEKNISDECDSFMFPHCSNITEQAMSKSTRLPSEDVSSPFSLVNTDILAYKGNAVPLVDIHPAHCSMRSSEDEDSSSTSLNESSSNQYVPSTVIGSKAPGEHLENMGPLCSQLNHKGLISMASDQPQ